MKTWIRQEVNYGVNDKDVYVYPTTREVINALHDAKFSGEYLEAVTKWLDDGANGILHLTIEDTTEVWERCSE